MMNMLLLWDSENHGRGVDQRLSIYKLEVSFFMEFFIDSGSSCNSIDQKMWEELKQKGVKCKSENTNQKLYPYGTSELLNMTEHAGKI